MAVAKKTIPEYNRHANISMVLGIIILCLPLTSFLLSLLLPFGFGQIFIFPGIAIVVMAIFGVIFGKKGLKSEKVGTARFGLVISGIVLLSVVGFVIGTIIYLATGGEIA